MTPPPKNPLTRLLAVVIGVLALAAFFTVGLIALAVVVGIGLVLWVVAWIRIRFFSPRRTTRTEQHSGTPPGDEARTDSIEAEYTVVSRETGDRERKD